MNGEEIVPAWDGLTYIKKSGRNGLSVSALAETEDRGEMIREVRRFPRGEGYSFGISPSRTIKISNIV